MCFSPDGVRGPFVSECRSCVCFFCWLSVDFAWACCERRLVSVFKEWAAADFLLAEVFLVCVSALERQECMFAIQHKLDLRSILLCSEKKMHVFEWCMACGILHAR